MENSNKIIPPHLNAEAYRTNENEVDKSIYLDYIRIHPDNGVLIGCSELTGRYWKGGASISKTIEDAQNNITVGDQSLASGTADGCFLIDSSKVILCEDSGAVSMWSVSEENAWQPLGEVSSMVGHDDVVLAIDCLRPDQEYVTVGADGNIKVWDVTEMACARSYAAAHTSAITGVSSRPNNRANFVTGSLDQYVTLWDDDVSEAVKDLIKHDCGIRCLQWLSENELLYGDDAGVLSMIDVRNPGVSTKLLNFPAAIHKIAVHPDLSKVAVCCDNKIVSVCDVKEDSTAKVIYHDRHMHSNFVRGLAWDVEDIKVLHTTGWDGHIRTHHIDWD